MPVYTCTTNTEVFDGQTKNELAAEITRIHAAINHVPTTYVNVVFHEVLSENLYSDSIPATALLRQLPPSKVVTSCPSPDRKALGSPNNGSTNKLAGLSPPKSRSPSWIL